MHFSALHLPILDILSNNTLTILQGRIRDGIIILRTVKVMATRTSHKRQLSNGEQSRAKKAEVGDERSTKSDTPTKHEADAEREDEVDDGFVYIINIEQCDGYSERTFGVIGACYTAKDAANMARQTANEYSLGWHETIDSYGCLTIAGEDDEGGDHKIEVQRLGVKPKGSVPETTLDTPASVSPFSRYF